MNRTILTIWMLLSMSLFCTVASGQAPAPANRVEVQGYGYVGLSLPSPEGVGLGMVGGGLEGLVHKGLGIGGDFGYITSPNPPGTGAFQVSPNLSYHFGDRRRTNTRWFVAAGPAIVIMPGRTAGGASIGIGMQTWPFDHVGFRVELRNLILSKEERDPYSTGRISGYNLGFRLGLCFR